MPQVLERPKPAAPVTTDGGSVVMEGISWESYVRLRDDAGPESRITYDHGRLEIMPPVSFGHGHRNKLLSRLVEAYMDASGISYDGVGIITLQRADLLRGCEGDEMYYIHAEPPADDEHLDLRVDEPPDLVVEIDLASRSIDKEPLYAAFGVAELWRMDRDVLRVRGRRDDGQGYQDLDASRLLPGLPLDTLREHLALRGELRQHAIVERWRGVIRR